VGRTGTGVSTRRSSRDAGGHRSVGAFPARRPTTLELSFLRQSPKKAPVVVVARSMRLRYAGFVLGLVIVVTACGDGDVSTPNTDGSTATTAASADSPATVSIPPDGEVASALSDMNDPSFPPPLVDPGEIISGGPPPDGIPSIDDPRFISVEEADEWLGGNEPIIYLEVNGEAHAYPVQILMWHEIVNDTVGGVPVAVTYCPLCNSAVSYRREANGEVTTFGTSGRLFASALVMYDRATESLWTHFDGRAVVGVLTGQQLEPISSPLLGWSDFKEAFPDALVLDRDATGYSRPYGENPYAGYDNPETEPFLFQGTVDDRAAAKQRVVGVAIDSAARAWSLEGLSDGTATATNDEVGEVPVVIFWKAGQASALESQQVVGGRDVGSVAVYSPVVDDTTLTFTVEGDVFVDEQTGSQWDIAGTSVSGELAGTSLDQIHHLDTFWFAWSTYQPETDLVDGI
jgi:hypothetical protein